MSKNREGREVCYYHENKPAVARKRGRPLCSYCLAGKGKKENKRKIKKPGQKLLCRNHHASKNNSRLATWIIDSLPLCDICEEVWEKMKKGTFKADVFDLGILCGHPLVQECTQFSAFVTQVKHPVDQY